MVGVVEGSQTDRFVLVIAESLVGTQTSEHTAHDLRKTEDPPVTLLVDTIFLPSLSRNGICF